MGLRNEIEESVRPLGIRNFRQLVEKSREVEAMKNRRSSRQESGGPIRSGQKQARKGDKSKFHQKKPYQRPSARDRMLEVVEFRLLRRMLFSSNARRLGIMQTNVERVQL